MDIMDITTHQIQGMMVTNSHIGAAVIYVPRHANGDTTHRDCEKGYIKSWNSRGIFVSYSGAVQMTPPELLIWD